MSRLRNRLASMNKKSELDEKKLNSFIDKSLNQGLRNINDEDLENIKRYEIISKGTINDDKSTTTTFEIKIIY